MQSTQSTISFWFIVDVSGSVHGQKIAAVNAVLTECLDELKSIDGMVNDTLCMGLIAFSDKMEVINEGEPVSSITLPQIVVKQGEDGFYPITSYACLYDGMERVVKELSLMGKKNNQNYLFLVTDGKAADSGEYMEQLENAKNCVAYKKAYRYVAIVGDDLEVLDSDTLCFVDYKADRIMKLVDLPSEISKFKLTCFSDALYDTIFQD